MNDELKPEYEFDYLQAKPNRFAAKMQKGGRLVVLDPEVAEAFKESESVNAALRAVLAEKKSKSESNPVIGS